MFGFTLKDFLGFERMVASSLVKLVYWIGIILGGLAAISQVFAAFGVMRYSFGGGISYLLAAIVGTVIGVLFWRVLCEGMIIMFGIYDRLGEIKRDLARGSQA
ncbi:DUF4282 domain-containing protein [Aerophototrophica crusticola]|uniref:DUF4282 domain-containing protein n=1 Tax=Aerophototrophica crusticola TaxID=1709002 RepID=A0A858R976_9PROT|nr:DUF4282 domain-containing protein [Rhodospirillaceae bacterium B3]